jgi:hypothetical protein
MGELRSARTEELRSARTGHIAGFLGVFALVAWATFQNITRDSLWNDELSSVFRATQPTLGRVWEVAVKDVHPPGYYVLLHFVTVVWGRSELAVRGLSYGLGLLGAVGTYCLGRRIFGELEGLLALALVAITQTFIVYAGEARMYMLMLTAMVWAAVSGLEFVRGRVRVRALAAGGLVAFGAIAAYAHYIALLYLGLLALVLFGLAFRNRALTIRLLGLWLAIALLYAPWAREFLHDLSDSKAWMPRPSWGEWKNYLSFVLGRNVAILSGSLALLGLAYGVSGRERTSLFVRFGGRELALFGWVAVPFVVLLVKSRWSEGSSSVYIDRALIASLPAAALLAARGAARTIVLVPRMERVAPALPVLLGGYLAWAATSRGGIHKPVREEFREVAQDVVVRARAPEAIVVASAFNRFYFDYYFEALGSPLRVDVMGSSANEARRVRSALKKGDACQSFYVYGHRKLEPQVIKAFSEADFRKVTERRRRGAGFLEFERRSCRSE